MGVFDKQGSGEKQERKGSLASQVANAETYGDRTPLPLAGAYPILYLDSLRLITSRKGDDILIAEFDVIQSLVSDRPPGTLMADMFNFRYESTAGEVRKFLAALNGVGIDDIDADGVEACWSDKNPCHGRLVRMDATKKEREGKPTLTICRYTALPPETQAKAEELREAAGHTPF